MRFTSREQVGEMLAQRLVAYRGQHPLVLGVPRGAVPMAAIVAEALGGDLDVVLVRKLRAEGQPEFAIGAIDESGTVLEGPYFDAVSEPYVKQEIRTQLDVLRARRELYTRARPSIPPAGRIVIIVDDGVATGASMLSAIHLVRARGTRRVVVAVGVAPPDTLARLGAVADEIVCLQAPSDLHAVGQFYDDFSEVSDAQVVAALERAASRASGSSGAGVAAKNPHEP
jgi:predicted phosphoribosyltransferase